MACSHCYSVDPSMHAPGYHHAHCLPQAGLKPGLDKDQFRFNRVMPEYPPDPCISPNEGDLLCPPDCGYEKRNDLMPTAGLPSQIGGEMFQFCKTYPKQAKPKPMAACRCPVFKQHAPCTSLGPITDQLKCPCSNRTSSGQGKPQGQTFPSNFAPVPPMPVEHRCDNFQDSPSTTASPNDFYQSSMRPGAAAPTPNTAMVDSGGVKNKLATFGCPDESCQHPYYPSPGYICRPVYDRKYLSDCPEQDGPPPDCYTFL